MAISLAQITGLFGPRVQGGGLLGIAYGLGTSATPANVQNPVLALRQADRNKDRDIARAAAQPETRRDIAAFRTAVGKAQSADTLLADPAAMKLLLTANGLADHIPHPALARKALLSDVTDPNALANKLADPRWKSTAMTYDFAHKGLAILRDPKVMATLESAYAEVIWRKSLDVATPGLSDALTFRAEAGKTTSALQVLGDPVLRRVVTTTLGLPLQIAFQSVEAQERAISTRIDIRKLSDPKFVDSFAQRYLITRARDAAAGADGTQAAIPDVSTLAGRSSGLLV